MQSYMSVPVQWYLTDTRLGCRAAQNVAVINPGFSTHSQMMSQRYMFLDCSCPRLWRKWTTPSHLLQW